MNPPSPKRSKALILIGSLVVCMLFGFASYRFFATPDEDKALQVNLDKLATVARSERLEREHKWEEGQAKFTATLMPPRNAVAIITQDEARAALGRCGEFQDAVSFFVPRRFVGKDLLDTLRRYPILQPLSARHIIELQPPIELRFQTSKQLEKAPKAVFIHVLQANPPTNVEELGGEYALRMGRRKIGELFLADRYKEPVHVSFGWCYESDARCLASRNNLTSAATLSKFGDEWRVDSMTLMTEFGGESSPCTVPGTFRQVSSPWDITKDYPVDPAANPYH